MILDKIEAEIDNIRAAWSRAVAEAWLDQIACVLGGLATFYAIRNWNMEAIRLLRAADGVLQDRPETPELAQLRLRVLLKLMGPFLAVNGYGATETGELCHTAWSLCQRVEQTPGLIQVLYSLGAYYGTRSDFKAGLDVAAQGLALAEQYAAEVEDQGLLILIHDLYAFMYIYMGRFEEGLQHGRFMVEYYDPARHAALARTVGADVGVFGLLRVAWALCFLGYLDQSVGYARQALALAESLESAHSIGFASAFTLAILFRRGDWESGEELNQAFVDLCQTHRLDYWLVTALAHRALWLNHNGNADDGLATMKIAITAWKATGAEISMPFWLEYLADLLWQAGQLEASQDAVREGLQRIARTGERINESALLRIQGELLLAKGDGAAAERMFEQAIAVAREQHAQLFELRATMSLFLLWQRQGRASEARARLQAVYAWFTEGFDTVDLREARALLDEPSAA